MGDITIRKDDLIDKILRQQPRKFLFRIDGNTFRIIGPGQFWGVISISDERDLSGGECNNPIGGATSKIGIKIMKIPASRPENDDPEGYLL
jgi:hypothetical protein